MAMILEASMKKLFESLADFALKEGVMLLGVKDEIQKLGEQMENIQCLLKDAEKKRFNESSSTQLWLSKFKDVMYDAEDIIDRCRIEGTLLRADQNLESRTSSICCDFLSAFSSCFTSVLLRHEIGNRIKDINRRLKQIDEDSTRYKIEKPAISETPQTQQTTPTLVDSRQTNYMEDPFVVGSDVEIAANSLVDGLLGENVNEKCRLFAVTGMGGIGKTTLAQKIFNHPEIQKFFKLKVWVCISQTYSEIDLLKQVIEEAKGSCGNSNTKPNLQIVLRDSVALGESLFLVLDDVWTVKLWDDLLRVPLHRSNVNVRVLVTTRDEGVANGMHAACIHTVTSLSEERSWDMLRRRLFSVEQEELANGFKDLGLAIVNKCKGLPLAIKVTAEVLARKNRTRTEWEAVLRNDAWSISKLPGELRGALYLSFKDLPPHLKQCFLYFSLYPEDAALDLQEFAQIWVAEGFISKQQDSLMEDLAKIYFNELLSRNLLLPKEFTVGKYKMHDLIRSLAIFLSKEEASFVVSKETSNERIFTTSIKLRRLSVVNTKEIEILNSIGVDHGALRTLLASSSNLLLNDKRLKRLSHLRVLDMSKTELQVLPDAIGNLIHLRYLNLNCTQIREIPKSIGQLSNLQFLDLSFCKKLEQFPSGITQLHNLRCLDIDETPISFIPKGIKNLQQLNYLNGFVVANDDPSSSKLEELNFLKKIRKLKIINLNRSQSETIVLKELPNLSTLKLKFFVNLEFSSFNQEQEQAVEELFDKIIPPKSLENFKINCFFGRRYPNWMVSSSFQNCLPNLTKLVFKDIESCSQLPPLGQLPELRELKIIAAIKVEKIGPEFCGSDVNLTRIAFPKLEQFYIEDCSELEEWSFGEQVEQNARLPCLQELCIDFCPLLKQLPEDLKFSPVKHLMISHASSLKSVDNLPAEIEVLRLSGCRNLKKVCCPPTLKELVVFRCYSLAYVEKLDSLQCLHFNDDRAESLPEWLLKHLQQWEGLQNEYNDDFRLEMCFNEMVFRECLKGGIYWNLIQHIPHVYISDFQRHLRYSKQPPIYDTDFN